MLKKLALTAIVVAFSNGRKAAGEALADGENAQYFKPLCGIIRAASAKPEAVPEQPVKDDLETTALLINLSYASPKAMSELTEADDPKGLLNDDKTEAHRQCTGEAKADCIKAAAKAKSAKTDRTIKRLMEAGRNGVNAAATTATLKQLLDTINEARTAQKNIDNAAITQTLSEALQNVKTGEATDAALNKGGDNRATACGRPGSAPAKGTTAGTSIAHDALCICGYDTTNDQKKGVRARLNVRHRRDRLGDSWQSTQPMEDTPRPLQRRRSGGQARQRDTNNTCHKPPKRRDDREPNKQRHSRQRRLHRKRPE
uniref:Variant surface glycoprotein 1722 n=1 Tax=Trypanosoma brucei TaxID=5691 RepID=M4TC99_9TRYP|nr:variant surface glycoprotein 1722 [Trypanosoma brucei]